MAPQSSLASGDAALLARLGHDEVEQRLAERGLAAAELASVHRALRKVRRQGYAINNQATETGVTAIGYAVDASGGSAPAALSIAMPTARYSRALLPGHVGALRGAANAIERDLRSTATAWSRQEE